MTTREVFDAVAAVQKQDWAAVARISSKLAASSPDDVGFKIVDATVLAQPLPPIRWLVEALDICPGAPTLIAGYGFSGKTIAAQSAALTLATGRGQIWGLFASAGMASRVVHLDWEQGPRLTSWRYQRLASGLGVDLRELGDRLGLVSLADRYLDNPRAEAALMRVADGRHLAIVDSLRAACPALDENSSEIRGPLDLLGKVSEATGCCFIVLHHARKPNKENAGGAKYAIRGSGALFDACQSVLLFSKEEKGQPTLVRHETARISGKQTDDFALSVEDVPGGLVVVGGGVVIETPEERDRTRREEVRSKIIEVLTELKFVSSFNKVFERVGGNRKLGLSVWADLLNEKVIDTDGHAYFMKVGV